MTADHAYGLACQGVGLLWRGDFQNARQMSVALARRADRPSGLSEKSAASRTPESRAEAFHLHRQARSQRARTLGSLLVPLEEDYRVLLRRAPDVRQACMDVFGAAEGISVISLRALLGLIGAYEWRTSGIEIAAIGGRIHPHYGVFAPIRGEYVHLVATAPLPDFKTSSGVAFDIGTGTGAALPGSLPSGVRLEVSAQVEARESLGCLCFVLLLKLFIENEASDNSTRMPAAAPVGIRGFVVLGSVHSPDSILRRCWASRPSAPILLS